MEASWEYHENTVDICNWMTMETEKHLASDLNKNKVHQQYLKMRCGDATVYGRFAEKLRVTDFHIHYTSPRIIVSSWHVREVEIA